MRKKLRLNNTEQQEHNANVKRLRAVSIIMSDEEPIPDAQLLILEQIGGPTGSFVHAPSVGGYGIAVWVRIVPLKSGISVCDCQVTPQEWDDTGICLVDATEGVPYYTVPGGVEYPEDEVLNHWMSGRRYLKNGQILQGVVIAQSFASLPARCCAGIEVEVELTFVDQFGNRYPLKVDLMVVRDKKNTERPTRHAGLYAPTSRESMNGLWSERDLSSRASISPKEPNVPQANGAAHITDASRGVDFKRIS
jgi:hypothetical protein